MSFIAEVIAAVLGAIIFVIYVSKSVLDPWQNDLDAIVPGDQNGDPRPRRSMGDASGHAAAREWSKRRSISDQEPLHQ